LIDSSSASFSLSFSSSLYQRLNPSGSKLPPATPILIFPNLFIGPRSKEKSKFLCENQKILKARFLNSPLKARVSASSIIRPNSSGGIIAGSNP